MKKLEMLPVTSQTKHRLGQPERVVKINYSNCWNPLEPLKLQQ